LIAWQTSISYLTICFLLQVLSDGLWQYKVLVVVAHVIISLIASVTNAHAGDCLLWSPFHRPLKIQRLVVALRGLQHASASNARQSPVTTSPQPLLRQAPRRSSMQWAMQLHHLHMLARGANAVL
jgi:hypothetical protein